MPVSYNESVRSCAVLALLLVSLPTAGAGFPNPFTARPWNIRLPGTEIPPNVDAYFDLPYTDNGDARKSRLDLFVPKGQTDFPVVVFVHGGAWRVGDRSLYRGLGNRLARSGVGVAIPSFRQMGLAANAHPAQVNDVAAAFAWVRGNIAGYGGDPSRVYVAGHSSGGHLVSLLALDGRYLAAHRLNSSSIRGVISMSGVYSVDRLPFFHAQGKRRDASPMHYIHSGAPPFLLTYCQWDFTGLPGQARKFAAELRKESVPVELLRIPRDNHISEILNITKDNAPLVNAILRFVQ